MLIKKLKSLDCKSLLMWSKSKQPDIWLSLLLQCVIWNSIFKMHNKYSKITRKVN